MAAPRRVDAAPGGWLAEGGEGSFHDEVAIGLTLRGAAGSFTVPGGQVKAVSLDWRRARFDGRVEFWLTPETDNASLVAALAAPDPLTVELSLSTKRAVPTGVAPPPLLLKGLARGRSRAGLAYGPGTAATTFQHCAVEFADAAWVLWRQHRPNELYTDKSLGDVLSAHRPEGLALALELPALQAPRAMLFLGLGVDPSGASFHDWVCWLCDTLGASLDLDASTSTLRIADGRPDGASAATADRAEVAAVELLPAPAPRHQVRVHNAYAMASTGTTAVPQAQSVDPLTHDHLVRTQVTAEAEARVALETARLVVPRAGARLRFAGLPSVPAQPGALLSLSGPSWEQGSSVSDSTFRVVALRVEVRAERPGPHDEAQRLSAAYRVACEARLEDAAETAIEVPPYRVPRYPAYAEGKVVSPGGTDTERTWFVSANDKTGVESWRVMVPLWNKTVDVPLTPHDFSGAFWHPPYKHERVLVALHFDRAELHRYLDWAARARLPNDGQGDALLLGKKDKDQTTLVHSYVDGKPSFVTARVHAGDQQTLALTEGNALFKVLEEQGQGAAQPTFDVSPQVESARADASAGVAEGLGKAAAALGTSKGNVKKEITAASATAEGALADANEAVGAKAAEVQGAIEGAVSGLDGSAAALAGVAASARASLLGLLG